MGACMSKSNADAAAASPAKPTAAEAAKDAVSEEKPKPMIFALMRNGHEVIRGAMRDLQVTIDSGDLAKSQEEWNNLKKWTSLHMAMEEGKGEETPRGFFRLLDEHCDSVATKNHLHDNHEELHTTQQALEDAFTSGDIQAVKTAFDTYMEADEKHLKHEESIMMPMVQKLVKEGHPMKKYMKEELLAAVDDKEFFIKYAVGTLERHSQEMPRFRVFSHALWGVASDDEWTQWNAWIKETVSAETYSHLEKVL